ncbi:MAG: hypothetical protein ACOH1Y_00975 [Propionicimonas sp.]
MKSTSAAIMLVGGILLIALGLVWTLQGVGILGGSAMSGSMTWAIVGPIIAIVGIYLVVRWRKARSTT